VRQWVVGAWRAAQRRGCVLRATLPSDARPTGYRYGDTLQLYVAASDQDSAVYLVAPGGAERWPRTDPMTLCS
jgi:hypothetical protein